MPDLRPLQRFVLRTGGLPPMGWAYRAAYRAAERWVLWDWPRRFPQIERLEVRRGMASAAWTPGASDLDLRAILAPMSLEEEARFLPAFWARYAAVKRAAPFLGEVQLLGREEEPHVARWGGARERGPGGAAGARRAWENLAEAMNAGLFLLQDAWFGPEDAPDFGFKIAKGYLDASRYAAAARVDEASAVPSRADWARRPDLESAAALLREPLRLGRSEALQLCCRALVELDAACARFTKDAQPSPDSGWRWRGDLPNSELLMWKKRVSTFDHDGLPKVRGLYYDGMFRWLVVADAGDEADLRRLFEQALRWRREDPFFGNQPSILTPAMFQALLWLPFLDSPFLHHSLAGELGPLLIAARARGRSPLLGWGQRAQWKLSARDFSPPPPEVLEWSLGLSVANLALSLRLFALPGWAGDNAYRLALLYGRLLSARLFRHDGVARDPDDLESLAEAARALPEWPRLEGPLMRALETPTPRLNARDPLECFLEHYPSYRLLLDALLGSFRAS